MPIKKILALAYDAIILLMNRMHALLSKIKRKEVPLKLYKQYCFATKDQIELSKRDYYLSKFEMHIYDTTATGKFLKSICRNLSLKYMFSPRLTLAMVLFPTQKLRPIVLMKTLPLLVVI